MKYRDCEDHQLINVRLIVRNLKVLNGRFATLWDSSAMCIYDPALRDSNSRAISLARAND